MGICFGVSFYKSHVYEPQIIRGQFLFQRFVMLKVFFGAMGIGALIFSALSSMKAKAFDQVRTLWRPTSLTRSWSSGPVLGGVLLGMGMSLSGACPGMVWIALGTGTSNSLLTIAGGVLGASAYGVYADAIQEKLLNRGPMGPCSQVYADEAMRKSSTMLTFILGMVCLGGCALLETLVPWKTELPNRLSEALSEPMCEFGSPEFSFFECPAWPPSIAGMLLGALQLPGVVFVGNVLGSATAFQILSSLCLAPLGLSSKYVRIFATPNPLAWFQLPYVGVASVIAHLLAGKSGDLKGAIGVDEMQAFLGGFVLIFGSRLAGGCTSGHGLSGCAMLMTQSWIAVPSMFAGGIALSILLQACDGKFFVL